MERRYQRLVLALGLLAALSAPAAQAQDDAGDTTLEDIISPDLERRTIKEGQIDTEIWELGFYAGAISIEDFGTNDVFGARAALHVSEDFFFEANIAMASVAETSYEVLEGDAVILDPDDRELYYYNLNLGINIFPGDIYIGSRGFHNNLYLIVGAGNTMFADDEYFTYNFGAGYRFFATDWLSLRLDVRNHVFTHTLFGPEKEVQNLEAHLGLALFF